MHTKFVEIIQKPKALIKLARKHLIKNCFYWLIPKGYGWMALAMPKAAADAMAPIRAVCKALLRGLLPVK